MTGSSSSDAVPIHQGELETDKLAEQVGEIVKLENELNAARLDDQTTAEQLHLLQNGIATATILRDFVRLKIPGELILEVFGYLVARQFPAARLDKMPLSADVRTSLLGDTALAHVFEQDLYKVFLCTSRLSATQVGQGLASIGMPSESVRHLSFHLGTLDAYADHDYSSGRRERISADHFAPSFSKGPFAKKIAQMKDVVPAFPSIRSFAMALQVRLPEDVDIKDLRRNDAWYSEQYVAFLQLASTALPDCQIALKVKVVRMVDDRRCVIVGRELLLKPSPTEGRQGDTGEGLMWDVFKAMLY